MKTKSNHSNVNVSRRRFMTSLAFGASVLAQPVWGLSSRQTVTILTNHNDDTFSLFEEAFEKSQSKYRVKLMWMMPPDALRFLHRKDSASLDVWWQAAPHNHIADIAKEGLLQPLPTLDDGLPTTIGKVPLVAADNSFHATQLTAFSFLVNRKAITAQHLPWPEDWSVLAQPEYAGKIALSNPAKVRFNNILLDIVLQNYGWEKGWAMLSEISGNAVLLSKGLTDEVSSERQPVALHIDIVPNAEQRLRQPLDRIYPAHGGIINAGYIGILKHSPNVEGARAFVNFVLSAQGQQLMPRTDLPRLPVRPAVYAALGKEQFDPFGAEKSGQLGFMAGAEEAGQGLGRSAVITALFGAMTKDHVQLSSLWARLHGAEKNADTSHAARIAQIRSMLQQVPLDASQANSEEIRKAFRPSRSQQTTTSPADLPVQDQLQTPTSVSENKNSVSEAAKILVATWEKAFQNNQSSAARLLGEVGV